MFTRESQYEDLKILYLESGFVTSDEANCGYEDYIFAVRKKWLFDYMSMVADHEITEEWLDNWLLNEYTGDDSYQVYMAAELQGEIIFEGPIYPKGKVNRCLYTVRDELRTDGEYEDQMYLQTTNKEEALKRFDEEVKKVKKQIKDGDFFLQDVDGEIRTRIADGLPALEFEDEDGDYYYLYVERTEFSDWRK